MIPKISDKYSKYFKFKDFFECSDTYKISSIPNIPTIIDEKAPPNSQKSGTIRPAIIYVALMPLSNFENFA